MHSRFLTGILLCSLFLTSCAGPVDKDPHVNLDLPGHDFQNKYALSGAVSFQETDRIFCGTNLIGSTLFYYDKSSATSGVLCPDPACTHEDATCSAHIQSGAGLSVYDDMLYLIAPDTSSAGREEYLWRQDLFGRGREKLKKLSFDEVILPYQPQRYIVHRGKLYLLGKADTVGKDGISPVTRISLLSTSLGDGETFATLYDQTWDENINPTVFFKGDTAYLSLPSFTQEGRINLTILRYNLADGSSETIYQENETEMSPRPLWVSEEGEIYMPAASDTIQSLNKLEEGKTAEIKAWDGEANLYAMDDVAVRLARKDEIYLVQIVNFSGEVLYDGPLLPQGIPGFEGDLNTWNPMIVGGDKDKLILNMSNLGTQGMEDYTLMLDVHNKLAPTLLWSSVN